MYANTWQIIHFKCKFCRRHVHVTLIRELSILFGNEAIQRLNFGNANAPPATIKNAFSVSYIDVTGDQCWRWRYTPIFSTNITFPCDIFLWTAYGRLKDIFSTSVQVPSRLVRRSEFEHVLADRLERTKYCFWYVVFVGIVLKCIRKVLNHIRIFRHEGPITSTPSS